FRRVIAAADAAAFLALLWFVPAFFPLERPVRHLERWLVYVAGGHVCGHLLYDRLPLVSGALVLGAVGLLGRRLPAAARLLPFALAVNFQISPLVVAPVVAFGLVPVERFREGARPLFLAVVGRGLEVGAWVAAVFLPFFLYEGAVCLGLFHFHG